MRFRIIHARSRPVGLAPTLRARRAPRRFRLHLPVSKAVVGNRRVAIAAVVFAIGLAASPPASAQVEVEADPIAYGLSGFSLHLAGIFGGYRFSVGTFGIDVPRFLHGNEGWSATMRGAGVKADLLGGRIDGFFVGADANYYRMSYALDEPAATAKRNEYSVGLRGGYRLPIRRSGLYLAPWVGVGYNFGDGDLVIGDQTFEHSPVTLFPTVHFGWRF
jgi:hypothetical protein